MNKKLLHKLEHHLQMSKIKLSTARNDNINLKNRAQDLRREKLLLLQILTDLVGAFCWFLCVFVFIYIYQSQNKESSTAKRKTKHCQKEIVILNEKKHKVKVAIGAIKQKMLRDMEDFSTELHKAKQNISETQDNIMSTIREKLANTFSMVDGDDSLLAAHHWTTSYDSVLPATLLGSRTAPTTARKTADSYHAAQHHGPAIGHTAQEAEMLLKDTEFLRLEDLLAALQQSEDQVFTLYHETQNRHEEVENMELENKHLEMQVQEQVGCIQL